MLATSPMSLIATTSSSGRSNATLKACRPIRPNPLIATRVDIHSPCIAGGVGKGLGVGTAVPGPSPLLVTILGHHVGGCLRPAPFQTVITGRICPHWAEIPIIERLGAEVGRVYVGSSMKRPKAQPTTDAPFL